MRGSFLKLLVCGSVAMSGCSADVQSTEAGDGEVSGTEQAIVRARANGGPDQVVLLYMQTIINGQLRARTCTGTYTADRLVVTAAHCLTDVWGNQLFAYFGDHFDQDLATLPITGQTITIPAPGANTPFAQADSYESHPAWNAQQVYPDLGVVYLDRKLPFKPMPLLKSRVEDSSINQAATLVGWGASQALSADITQTVGGHVQRTGKTRLLGSPTAADYHADDPNPGMLVPSVRHNTLKTDGHAPYSNTCAGDSGGPLILSQNGKDVVAGVGSWTGLWCEDYSLHTRIDPFLPFFKQAEDKTGSLAVVPHLECVAPNADGTLSAYFGYNNANGVHVDVAHGGQNALDRDSASRRPTNFSPGRHDFVFGVDFKPNQELTYRLKATSGAPTTLKVDAKSPRCGAAQAVQVACAGACRAQLAAGCTDALPSSAQCIGDCVSFATSFPMCEAQSNAMNQCYGATPTGPDHWICSGDGFLPISVDCGAQEGAFYECLMSQF